MRRLRPHLTYANVVSTLCLFALLGGGAYAATKVSKNSVKSKQIKDGQVKAQDIAAGAITADKLAPNAVSAGSIADGSVTGAEIDESTLRGVDSDTVNGLQVREVNYQTSVGSPVQNVLVYPGIFRIDAQCQNFGDLLDISAATGVDNSKITVAAMASQGANDTNAMRDIVSRGDVDVDVGEVIEVDSTSELGVTGSSSLVLHYANPRGFSVTATLDASFIGDRCSLTGFAIAG